MIIQDEHQLTVAVLAEAERVGDPRFKGIVQALVRHLHDFAREVRLTEGEFDTALNIVTRLGTTSSMRRAGFRKANASLRRRPPMAAPRLFDQMF
jgi:hypothetical protein